MTVEPTKRLDALDSLRGIVALRVVFRHFENNLPSAAWPDFANRHARVLELLLKPFITGSETVLLFFILSGFVLSIPAVELRAQSYPVFVVRRVFRIYVPYLASLVLAVAIRTWYFWPTPVDWRLVLQHVLFLGQYDSDRYNAPIWTLIHEMRISLVFPILCALSLKLSPVRSLLAAVCVDAVAVVARHFTDSLAGVEPILDTLHLAILFVVGIFLARERACIAEWFNSLSMRMKIGLAVLSALLLLYSETFWLEIGNRMASHQLSGVANWFMAAGTAGVLVFSLNSGRCKRILLWTPIHNLGKMSFSLYLLHYPIGFYLTRVLQGKMPPFAIQAVCLGVAIFAAWVFYRLVEAPSIQWGRRLSRLVQPRVALT